MLGSTGGGGRPRVHRAHQARQGACRVYQGWWVLARVVQEGLGPFSWVSGGLEALWMDPLRQPIRGGGLTGGRRVYLGRLALHLDRLALHLDRLALHLDRLALHREKERGAKGKGTPLPRLGRHRHAGHAPLVLL